MILKRTNSQNEKGEYKRTEKRKKVEKTFLHVKKLRINVIILSILFVVLSYTGVHLIWADGVDSFYKYIIQVLLVFNLILLFVFRELWKQERNRMRYFGHYTLTASRK